jgi:hypothetical protein
MTPTLPEGSFGAREESNSRVLLIRLWRDRSLRARVLALPDPASPSGRPVTVAVADSEDDMCAAIRRGCRRVFRDQWSRGHG